MRHVHRPFFCTAVFPHTHTMMANGNPGGALLYHADISAVPAPTMTNQARRETVAAALDASLLAYVAAADRVARAETEDDIAQRTRVADLRLAHVNTVLSVHNKFRSSYGSRLFGSDPPGTAPALSTQQFIMHCGAWAFIFLLSILGTFMPYLFTDRSAYHYSTVQECNRDNHCRAWTFSSSYRREGSQWTAMVAGRVFIIMSFTFVPLAAGITLWALKSASRRISVAALGLQVLLFITNTLGLVLVAATFHYFRLKGHASFGLLVLNSVLIATYAVYNYIIRVSLSRERDGSGPIQV